MHRALPGARVVVISLVLAGTACEVSSHGPREREKTEAARMIPAAEADSIAGAVRDAVMAAFATGAAAGNGLSALYAPDAVMSDVMEQTYSGHGAVAASFAQGMPPGASIDIRSSGAIGSGDLVVDMGTYTFSMPNPQGGARTQMRGRYMITLQRMDDGSWKIVRQMDDELGAGGPPAGAPAADSAAAGSSAPASPTPPRAETGFTTER